MWEFQRDSAVCEMLAQYSPIDQVLFGDHSHRNHYVYKHDNTTGQRKTTTCTYPPSNRIDRPSGGTKWKNDGAVIDVETIHE